MKQMLDFFLKSIRQSSMFVFTLSTGKFSVNLVFINWCFSFVYDCVFFNLCVFFPEHVQSGVCLFVLSRFKIGIGKRRCNNVTEFYRSCSTSDRPIVLESDRSIVQQFESHTVFCATWIWCLWNFYYFLSTWPTLWKTYLSTWIIQIT